MLRLSLISLNICLVIPHPLPAAFTSSHLSVVDIEVAPSLAVSVPAISPVASPALDLHTVNAETERFPLFLTLLDNSACPHSFTGHASCMCVWRGGGSFHGFVAHSVLLGILAVQLPPPHHVDIVSISAGSPLDGSSFFSCELL